MSISASSPAAFRSGATRPRTAPVWLALLAASLFSTAGAAQNPLPPGEPAPDLAQDPRLRVAVSPSSRSATLQNLLRQVQAPDVELTAEPEIELRRASCFGQGMHLRSVMEGLASTLRLSWRRVDARRYELYRTRAQRERERSELARSEALARRAAAAKREALLAAARHARAAGSAGPAVTGLLSRLDPEQLALALELAAAPSGPISASSNSHLHDRVVGLTPVRALPAALRGGIAAQLGGLDGERFRVPPEGAFAGLVASDGGFALGIVDAAGRDVWVCPAGRIQRAGIPGVDVDNDQDPEVTAALARSPLVQLQGMPAGTLAKRLRFPAEVKRTVFPDLLADLSERLGMPCVADDPLRSRRSPYPWLLTDRDEYTPAEALRQLAACYGRQVTYRDERLEFRSVVPGLDARCEPPPALVERLRGLAATRKACTYSDCSRLAALTEERQLTLQTGGQDLVGHGSDLNRVFRHRHLLRAHAALNDAEREGAESEEGVPVEELRRPVRSAFWRLSQAGIDPGLGAVGPRLRRVRVSIERAARSRERLTVTLIGSPGRRSEHRFETLGD